MTLILHTYTSQRIDEQEETKQIITRLSKDYPIVSKLCNDTDDYWKILLKHWGKDELIIIEQDIVPSFKMVQELEWCIDELCCFPYLLRDRRWSIFEKKDNIQTHYTEPLPKYAEYSSLGFTKISRRIQLSIPLQLYPVDEYKWWYLDSWISEFVGQLNMKFHVHQPSVKHNRRYELEIKVGDQSFMLTE